MNKSQKLMLLTGILTLGAAMVIMKFHSSDTYATTEETTTTSAAPVKIEAPSNGGVTKSIQKTRNIKVKSDQLLYFNVPVTGGSVDTAIVELGKMTAKYDDVYLLINSPGGSVFDGVRLTSYIASSTKNIHTVCVTLCASMAAHIFETGKTRLMFNGGIVMFHPASGGASGQVENMISMLGMIKTYIDKLDAYAVSRSNLNFNEFKAKVATEYWVSSDEAISTKLADEVVMVVSEDKENPYGKNLGNDFFKEKATIPHSLTTLPDIKL